MNERTIRLAMLALLPFGVAGCANGPVTGGVVVPGQLSPAPLTMRWKSGLLGGSGTMAAMMPDGERFSGSYVVVTRGMGKWRIEPAWAGDAPADARGDIDDSMWGAARDHVAFVNAHLNKAIATLKGDRGGTMLCRFALLASEAGMRGGGSGSCQTSKGARISANF